MTVKNKLEMTVKNKLEMTVKNSQEGGKRSAPPLSLQSIALRGVGALRLPPS
jgi:hypothetical protein